MTAPMPVSAPQPSRHSHQLWWGIDDIPSTWGPSVVTIGVFDGVHRGHARLIDRAVEIGRAHGIPTVLVTFDPHPARVVGPRRDTAALTTPAHRAELAAARGVDAVLVLPFTAALAALPPALFAQQVLVVALHASAVVVGRDFRFGHRAAGTVDTLRLLGRRWGFTAEGIDLVPIGGLRCSSTYVRSCLKEGKLRAAADALGRPHRVQGRLAPCGRLTLPPHTALPSAGVYPAELTVASGRTSAVAARVRTDGSVTLHPPPAPGPLATLDFLPRQPTT